ncbi:5-oxoprolinase subunit B family protein [Tessaracoccus antarcticus]|uniref:Allophanate hydrolase subunit 1 n=1 Tax=Tessaracoccus antarcticus TaxID=2479848 RepID=A0A3M0GBV7_9ACTN|nr:allophanate hydrolase subunit 1 [Tessaracoccus antarcticus]RMB59003.1 allophanate hydrolase subunit 1 [Tessaracoccus antarcticus]
MRVLPYGQRAWLLEMEDATGVRSLDAALRLLRVDGGGAWARIVDVVPAARSVLVTAASPSDAEALRNMLEALTDLPPRDSPDGRTVEIPVTYDGPDLEFVARACGLDVDEVVTAHTGTPWTVAFGGFAPGFAYLADGDARLRVGRREEPRTIVPPGAVALADGYSAVYPRRSPGGWQLIGHTRSAMWDASMAEPALLRPGMRVQFRALP